MRHSMNDENKEAGISVKVKKRRPENNDKQIDKAKASHASVIDYDVTVALKTQRKKGKAVRNASESEVACSGADGTGEATTAVSCGGGKKERSVAEECSTQTHVKLCKKKKHWERCRPDGGKRDVTHKGKENEDAGQERHVVIQHKKKKKKKVAVVNSCCASVQWPLDVDVAAGCGADSATGVSSNASGKTEHKKKRKIRSKGCDGPLGAVPDADDTDAKSTNGPQRQSKKKKQKTEGAGCGRDNRVACAKVEPISGEREDASANDVDVCRKRKKKRSRSIVEETRAPEPGEILSKHKEQTFEKKKKKKKSCGNGSEAVACPDGVDVVSPTPPVRECIAVNTHVMPELGTEAQPAAQHCAGSVATEAKFNMQIQEFHATLRRPSAWLTDEEYAHLKANLPNLSCCNDRDKACSYIRRGFVLERGIVFKRPSSEGRALRRVVHMSAIYRTLAHVVKERAPRSKEQLWKEVQATYWGITTKAVDLFVDGHPAEYFGFAAKAMPRKALPRGRTTKVVATTGGEPKVQGKAKTPKRKTKDDAARSKSKTTPKRKTKDNAARSESKTTTKRKRKDNAVGNDSKTAPKHKTKDNAAGNDSKTPAKGKRDVQSPAIKLSPGSKGFVLPLPRVQHQCCPQPRSLERCQMYQGRLYKTRRYDVSSDARSSVEFYDLPLCNKWDMFVM